MRTQILTFVYSTLIAASASAQLQAHFDQDIKVLVPPVYTTEADFLGAPGVINHTVTKIDFDTLPSGAALPHGTPVCGQYFPVDFGNTGSTYAAPPPANCNGTYKSPPNVLFNHPNGPSQPPSPIVIHFMAPVTAVGFWNTSQQDAVRVTFYGICNDVIADEIIPDAYPTCQTKFLGLVSNTPIYRVEVSDASPYATGFDTFFLDDLSYVLASTTENFQPFCFGTNCNCPCSDPTIHNGAIGGGCDNSLHTGGVRLCGWGDATAGAADTVEIGAWGGLPGQQVVLLQSQSDHVPAFAGDGLRCLGGVILRIGVSTFDTNGYAAWGEGHGDSISALSVAAGDPLASTSTRYYQALYIDGNSSFCTSSHANFSNAIEVIWN